MAIKIVGKAQKYAYTSKDKYGNYLDGDKNYRLNLPSNIPAKDFWSVCIYDPQTRSELQTSQPYPAKNSQRDPLKYNADGSIDLFFGPDLPEGKESNWIQTVSSKGWFAVLRLYGPLESWFDKTWRPGDFEQISSEYK